MRRVVFSFFVLASLGGCAPSAAQLLQVDEIGFDLRSFKFRVIGEGFPHGAEGRARISVETENSVGSEHVALLGTATAIDARNAEISLPASEIERLQRSSFQSLRGHVALEFPSAYAGVWLRGEGDVAWQRGTNGRSLDATPDIQPATSMSAAAITARQTLSVWFSVYALLLALFLWSSGPSREVQTPLHARKILPAFGVWCTTFVAAELLIPTEIRALVASTPVGMRIFAGLLIVRSYEEWRARLPSEQMSRVPIGLAATFATLWSTSAAHAFGVALLLALRLLFVHPPVGRPARALDAFAALVLLAPLPQPTADGEPLLLGLWVFLALIPKGLDVAFSRPDSPSLHSELPS